jgi:hypothetical protein
MALGPPASEYFAGIAQTGPVTEFMPLSFA